MKKLVALGGFAFEITKNAYSELASSWEWRWQETERIGNSSGMSFHGPSLESMTLVGTIYAQTAGKRYNSVDELKALADRGEPHSLVDSEGKKLGRYVIVSLSSTKTAITHENIARKLEFEVELKAYA